MMRCGLSRNEATEDLGFRASKGTPPPQKDRHGYSCLETRLLVGPSFPNRPLRKWQGCSECIVGNSEVLLGPF